MLLLNFPIRCSLKWKKINNKNNNLMIFKWVLFNDFNSMLLPSLDNLVWELVGKANFMGLLYTVQKSLEFFILVFNFRAIWSFWITKLPTWAHLCYIFNIVLSKNDTNIVVFRVFHLCRISLVNVDKIFCTKTCNFSFIEYNISINK